MLFPTWTGTTLLNIAGFCRQGCRRSWTQGMRLIKIHLACVDTPCRVRPRLIWWQAFFHASPTNIENFQGSSLYTPYLLSCSCLFINNHLKDCTDINAIFDSSTMDDNTLDHLLVAAANPDIVKKFTVANLSKELEAIASCPGVVHYVK